MKYLAGLVVGLCAAGAVGQGNPERAIPVAEARAAFGQARAAADADGGALWGVGLDGPMLFVDPGSRFVVANRADPEGTLEEEDGVWVGTLPDEVLVANTATAWEGVRWTMVMWPLPENRSSRARLLVHECFHRVQDGLGLPGSNPGNNHLDSRQGRTWLRMEWRALGEALVQRGEERRRAVGDALVFRAYRRSLFDQAAADERALEMNEGLAEYTGYRLCGLPTWVLADRAAVRIERDEPGGNFVRNFAYTSGPAYGILLDEAGADWRAGLSTDDDLGALLGDALRITLPEDLRAEVARRAERYDGPSVIAEETAREQAQRARQARLTARFVEGPVLVLPLGPQLSYSFDPNHASAFGGSGTVFGTARVTDAWGVLEVEAGVLLERDASGMMSRATLPAPTDPSGASLRGDGWTLELAEGWQLAPGAREGDWMASE